jgi:hypothetical protein
LTLQFILVPRRELARQEQVRPLLGPEPLLTPTEERVQSHSDIHYNTSSVDVLHEKRCNINTISISLPPWSGIIYARQRSSHLRPPRNHLHICGWPFSRICFHASDKTFVLCSLCDNRFGSIGRRSPAWPRTTVQGRSRRTSADLTIIQSTGPSL